MTPDQIGEYLEHQGATDDEIDDFLEHFGVKGMKWGQRKAARQKNRALNRESRAKDKVAFAKSVDKARGRVASGDVKRELKKAKADYKTAKLEIGSREAKKILNKKREKLYGEINLSRQARNGKEAALQVLTLFAVSTVSSLSTS